MLDSPVVIATWKFGTGACQAAWESFEKDGSVLDAVEAGANQVEENEEVNSVGYGGLPNREGVVELDAAIMNGVDHSAGAVCAITSIRKPISVARMVMEKTSHVMLAGGNARRFALQNGFQNSDLTTPASREKFNQWKLEQTAPDVAHFDDREKAWNEDGGSLDQVSHDTVGVCGVDINGNLAAACTTSGLAWKTPGRVGDSPIIGSGLYVDNNVGAAAATGNGDEMMKVCLSYRVIFLMDQGASPQEACEEAIKYLLRKRPDHQQHGAACIAISKTGEIGNAATQEGFSHPNRLWEFALVRSGHVILHEGVYVPAQV
ncbi:MAG: N(4)-(beta-N-acetylglucosaminyl)-L-asparaginase [Chthonomonadales bacterium]